MFSDFDAANLPASAGHAYGPGFVLGGKYVLLHELGSGATSIVWAARDQVLEVLVAVKIVARATEEREQFIKLALGEARVEARLSHPAVCRAIDFGVTELGDPFVVTEHLHGETLDALLEREGRLPAERAVRLLLPVVRALHAAHVLGIVHRDVKPANIFLHELPTGDVQPKLMDFGIARSLFEPRESSPGLYGTPHYMPPEQGAGGEVDARSDLWAVNASLFEALVGEPPFDGETVGAILNAVCVVDAPLLPLENGADAELRAIVKRGLTRDPGARWGSAAELERALSEWLIARGVETDVSGHALRFRSSDIARRQSNRDQPSSVRHRRAPARWIVGLGGAFAAMAGILIAPPSPRLRAKEPPRVDVPAGSTATTPVSRAASRVPASAVVVVPAVQLSSAPLVLEAGARPAGNSKQPSPRPERSPLRTQPAPDGAPSRADRPLPAPTASTAPQLPAVASRVERAPNALGYDFGF